MKIHQGVLHRGRVTSGCRLRERGCGRQFCRFRRSGWRIFRKRERLSQSIHLEPEFFTGFEFLLVSLVPFPRLFPVHKGSRARKPLVTGDYEMA